MGTADAAATALQPLGLEDITYTGPPMETDVAVQPMPGAKGQGSDDGKQLAAARAPVEHLVPMATSSEPSTPAPPIPFADNHEVYYDPAEGSAQEQAADCESLAAFGSASSVPLAAEPSPDNDTHGAAVGNASSGGMPAGFSLPITWGPSVAASQQLEQGPAAAADTAADDPSGQHMQTIASAHPVLMNGTSGSGSGLPFTRQAR